MTQNAKNKISTGLEEAIAHAKGKPSEGTRETWFDYRDWKWKKRVFKDGNWVGDDPKQ